ncbi:MULTISPECIES: beta-ketoacyl synthase N-terminal-like domain-containing protein [unclassified Mesorhizobium]|uniref:beta-ketoacyl synthase N-terminal-like domain-containing protein n=1 Tax=unclassified Mesorhizobium TaxID=325217 RepID=UPI000BB087F0|nr:MULTISPECIES: beta-ketoacyl synthase N-terminal-like domain-containing protein [unclassified Mesorhizobium]MDG4910650.1 beta-ketoacyl synthase N-terminal-like domain-containing protein [Mesorhizobium sp. WSM4898]PBB35258.1 3-oxoacyl-ACP synthase [Mesorhizobium sp. WSM3882]RUU95492.1 3-oxoacyl-ACP synthase [Mesorhizobium sp. M1A.F.Ca.IN.020.03.2.1]RUV81663.1 3-oxoacyl-ACP synthase [Mesorhizobium sp. M1A.F.Ca.IN.020.32.1.1]RUV94013.1 3-oxoacyl-ACP synthase [Mesorhizobium sp. M1A.F.Ca.IN.020.0
MSIAIDIAAIGMVTAVGLDAPSACAAMRARLDGFQETRFLGPSGQWLTGAPVPLPREWIGEKRMAHLAAAAICEAFESVPEARGQTALILCLAEESRPGRPIADGGRLLRHIAEIIDVEPHARSRIINHDRASGHVALEQARRMIASGEAPYVMIAGVDSYLTAPAIEHYQKNNRLLAPENPNGFIPGEAAAAVLCLRSGRGGFRLFGLGLAREVASIYNSDDLPLRGDGMTAAYDIAFKETGIEMSRLGYRIADLIGEQYWFKQSALASLRLLRGRHDFQDIWSPGESLGNVGAAAGPLMIGMAWMAARKGYAAGSPVLIEASNDAGACGAALFATRFD